MERQKKKSPIRRNSTSVGDISLLAACVCFIFSLNSCQDKTVQHDYYDSGKLKASYTYENGLRNGEAKGFYESGNVAFTSSYKKGLRVGWLTHYYDNRSKRVKEKKLYNENGKLIYLKSFDENGKVIYNQILPYIVSQKDTLNMGEEAELQLIFDFAIPITKIYFGTPGNHFTLQDTLEVRIVENGKKFNFRFTPLKPGPNKVGFLFKNEVKQGDSTNLNDIFPTHNVYVLDKRVEI